MVAFIPPMVRGNEILNSLKFASITRRKGRLKKEYDLHREGDDKAGVCG